MEVGRYIVHLKHISKLGYVTFKKFCSFFQVNCTRRVLLAVLFTARIHLLLAVQTGMSSNW